MSNAMQCDRCGKYYDLNPKNLPGTKTGPKYSINYYKQLENYSTKVESFDLCPDCARQVTEWADNPDSVVLNPNKTEKILEQANFERKLRLLKLWKATGNKYNIDEEEKINEKGYL